MEKIKNDFEYIKTVEGLNKLKTMLNSYGNIELAGINILNRIEYIENQLNIYNRKLKIEKLWN